MIDIEEIAKRLTRVEYELTEVRFRCKALECKQDPKHSAFYDKLKEEIK